MKKSIILAIETSCDETAMSLVKFSEQKGSFQFEILSNVVASQIEIHKKWGGVWPELASRAHLEAIIPVLEEALAPLTKVKSQKLKVKSEIKNLKLNGPFIIQNSVDAIAVTIGPGLIGSLLMGVETAQILGVLCNKPFIPVNHLEGHIYAAFCNKSQISNSNDQSSVKFQIPKHKIFPILSLIVSGGHTSLVLMEDHLKYKTVGQTVDDAAGEAFDKVARILGLGYPGGPEIEKLAKSGGENAYELPIAMKDSHDLNFSFSGLKTAVLYLTKNPTTGDKLPYNKRNLAASFQKTVAEILTLKTTQAIKKFKPKTVILSGGVSANEYLRDYFQKEISTVTSAHILIPPKNLSTDNAVGIGIAGAIKYFAGKTTSFDKINANANWRVDSI